MSARDDGGRIVFTAQQAREGCDRTAEIALVAENVRLREALAECARVMSCAVGEEDDVTAMLDYGAALDAARALLDAKGAGE